MSRDDEKVEVRGKSKIDLPTIIAIIITNLVTLTGSFLAFKTSQDQTRTEFMQTALRQVQEQSKEIVELRGMLLSSQLNVLDLESKIRKDLDEQELLIQFLDSLPFPAWIKRYDVEENQFVMTMLNQQYTAAFGYTRNQYIGKNDFEMHPAELAESYRKADIIVLETGYPDIRHQILISKNGEEKEIIVYKFAIYLPDGSRAVGGVAINKNDIGIAYKPI